jgi:hypothetical protein
MIQAVLVRRSLAGALPLHPANFYADNYEGLPPPVHAQTRFLRPPSQGGRLAHVYRQLPSWEHSRHSRTGGLKASRAAFDRLSVEL